jgi:hypothetical protein
MCPLRIDAVEEGHEDGFLHQLVDLGHGGV